MKKLFTLLGAVLMATTSFGQTNWTSVIVNGDFFGIGIENANIESDRLQFFDEDFERFRDAGFRNILAFNASFISLNPTEYIIRFNSENFLKSIVTN